MGKEIIILLCVIVTLYLLFAFVAMDMLWVLDGWLWRLLFVSISFLLTLGIINDLDDF